MDSIKELYSEFIETLSQLLNHPESQIIKKSQLLKTVMEVIVGDPSSTHIQGRLAIEIIQKLQLEGTLEDPFPMYNIFIEDFTQRGNKLALADIYESMTTAYYLAKDLEAAKETNQKELDLREEFGETKSIANAHHSRGVINHILGNLEIGKQEYATALKLGLSLLEKDQNEEHIKIVDLYTYSMANINQHYIGDFDTSFSFYQEGYKLANSQNNIDRMCFFLDHMGMAKFYNDNFVEAETYHQMAEDLFTDKTDINYLFHKLQWAQAAIGAKKFEEGLMHILQVSPLMKGNTDVFSNALYPLFISEILMNNPKLFTDENKKLLNFDDSFEFNELDLIEKGISVGEAANQANGLVVGKAYLARYLFTQNQEDERIKQLLIEAKEFGMKNNRGAALKLLKNICSEIKYEYSGL